MKKFKALYYSLYIILALIVIGYYLITYGNPIIKARVEKDAKEYIKTNHADLDLDIKGVSYQMMGSFYTVKLQDKESRDTCFELNYDHGGKFRYSTYDEILDNTYKRYEVFLKDYAKDIADEEAFDFELRLLPDNELKYEYYLKLDQDFDREHLPSKVLAHFHAYEDEPSLEGMMTRLKKVQKAIAKRNLDVHYYSGRIIPTADKAEEGMAEKWGSAISVDRVMEKTILDGNMETLERLYEHKK
ncbi:hypothetical protein [uncultured Fenollaria sp.]|uniref:YfjL-like protein n=1 Tax=uncultured Fenollaria sp. TaxID=1686315 RepID=UPI0025DF2782|nr:hypothetical protein [uncultured Fenollaria sp.]